MKKIVALILVLLVVPAVGMADSFKKYARPDAPKVGKNDQVLIMPIDLNLSVANEEQFIPTIMGGIKSALGKRSTSLQPMASAGMDKIARRFVSGVVHMVSFHNAYDFKNDAKYHGGKSDLPNLLNDVVYISKKAKEKFGIKEDIKYIVLARASKKGKSVSKKVGFVTIRATTVKVAAVIYNVKQQKIDRVIVYEKTGEMNAIVSGIGKEIGKNLLK